MSWRIIEGDVRERLADLEPESVQTCVTSPPYWGLRDYGTATWSGGDPECDHLAPPGGGTEASALSKQAKDDPRKANRERVETGQRQQYRDACRKCGATRIDSQLGLEPTPEEYVANMVEVFRGVRRVLRDDGTLWLNLGDSYASNGSGGDTRTGFNSRYFGRDYADGKQVGHGENRASVKRGPLTAGLKPKDLCGIPWAVAQALRDPYYTGVISDASDRRWLAGIIDSEGCIYISRSKAGATTGRGRNYQRTQDAFQVGVAVTQRSPELLHECQRIFGRGEVRQAHERAYEWRLYSANARDLLREVYPYLIGKQHEARLALGCPPSGKQATAAWEALKAIHQGGERDVDFKAPAGMFEPGYYLRSDIVWNKLNPMPESVTDRPTKAHEYLFLLTKSPRYFYDATAIREEFADERMGNPGDYAKTSAFERGVNNDRQDGGFIGDGGGWTRGAEVGGRNKRSVWTVTTQPFPGAHFATFPPKLIEPCILAGAAEGDAVLDPFAGAGTTGVVALRHNRDFIGIELNPTYAAMARDRIRDDAPLLNVGAEAA